MTKRYLLLDELVHNVDTYDDTLRGIVFNSLDAIQANIAADQQYTVIEFDTDDVFRVVIDCNFKVIRGRKGRG